MQIIYTIILGVFLIASFFLIFRFVKKMLINKFKGSISIEIKIFQLFSFDLKINKVE